MLQGGPEFARWRAGRPARRRAADPAPPVRVVRAGGVLRLTLDRPDVHNAVSPALRDALADALALAVVDDGIDRIVLDGAGPSFCSGGDLDTFGTFPDPATAHVVRLTRSPTRLLAAVARRTEVRVHGACLGAGVELAAFAARVVADPGTRLGLPEVPLGLVPGAGGTVSLPRRIGRQRTALLALTARPVDAATALEWGLVDEVAAVAGAGSSGRGAE
jgi:enoyl-CoA hydratase/carnithine racemase